MFKLILNANDGSGPAFKALELALDLAKQNGSELHMASVEEVASFPQLIGEVEIERKKADHRYKQVVRRAKTMAVEKGGDIGDPCAGRPPREKHCRSGG